MHTDFQTTSMGDLLINPKLYWFQRFVGIGIDDTMDPPENTLEINSGIFSPKPSGLKFRNLTSASTPENNPSDNVLSVDTSGNVILVPDGGAGDLDAVWYDVNNMGLPLDPENTLNDGNSFPGQLSPNLLI